MEENKVFIYGLLCPIKNQIRYIGKTNNIVKRLSSHLRDNRSITHKTNWIKSLKIKGLKPIIEILDEVSECEWQFWEQYYISLYKSWGFRLVNGDNGGLGMGRISEELRKKLSDSHKGLPGNTKGIKFSEERKIKQSYCNPKIKLVECHDTLNNIKFQILGTVNMAKYLKINRSSINENIRGKTKLVHNRYKFYYPCH